MKEEKRQENHLNKEEIRELAQNIALAIDRFQSQLRLDPKMAEGTVDVVVPVSMMSGKWCAAISLRQELDN